MKIPTAGGGFLLQKGAGTLLGYLVTGLLSNMYDTSWNTSSAVRTTQNNEIIKSEYQFKHQQLSNSRSYHQLTCGLDLPVAERVNPSKSKFFSAVACLKTSLAELSHPLDQHCKTQCYFRFPRLSSICGGNRCLFVHWGRMCISTRNHFWDAPFQ
jgi:hypothetical protein